MSPDRGVIFFYEGYLGIAPTVVNLAKTMAGDGYEVTIYATPTSYPDAGDLGPGIRVEYLSPGVLPRIAHWLNRLRLPRLSTTTTAWAVVSFAVRSTGHELRAVTGASPRTVYLGVDYPGALAARLTSLLRRGQYAFLSLELRMSASQLRGLHGLVARLVYRSAACVIVQGNDRLEVLNRQFRWTPRQIFLLPNAPLSSGAPSSPAPDNFFRNHLRIPASKRIALQAGMINDTACSKALAAAFAPQHDWALVFHERLKRSPDEPYLADLRRTNPDNLFLSLDPVPYDQVDHVFASADLGLAFYQPSGPSDENFSRISSSGKLPHYLKHGRPVLVSNLPAFAEVVQAYDCGLVVHDPSNAEEVGRALEQLLSRYDILSKNARRCFEERFDFGRSAAPLMQFFRQL
jgi:hypothetical protein